MNNHPPPLQNKAAAPPRSKAATQNESQPKVSSQNADRKPFVPAWLDDLSLTLPEFRLYCHLCRRAGKDGIAWTNAETIRKACRISRNTVWPTIDSLENNHRLIKRIGKPFGRANRYQVLAPITPNETPIDDHSIGTNETPIDDLPITPNGAPPITPNEGRQSPQMERHKGSPLRRESNRRESNRELFSIEETLPFQSEAFRDAWNAWTEHLSQKPKSKRPTEAALKGQLRKLADMGERAAISALHHSTQGSYQGIYQDPAFQPDSGKPRDFQELMAYATDNGVSEALAGAYYDESERAAWMDWRRNPIQNWKADFRAYVERKQKADSPPAKKPDLAANYRV